MSFKIDEHRTEIGHANVGAECELATRPGDGDSNQ
jgi:hypothetical protein